MNADAAGLPHVSLKRPDLVRMVIVGILVVIALIRVVPDAVRVVYPLQVFGYVTDGDGIVVRTAPATAAPGRAASRRAAPNTHVAVHSGNLISQIVDSFRPPPGRSGDQLLIGDRVRVDRIKPYDRKPGLVGRGFTYDNRDRYLPIERAGRERVVHLVAREELWPVRFLDMLRILLLIVSVSLGAILFLVKPSIATGAFFAFCLAGVEAPATYFDLIVPNPWRQIPSFANDIVRGAVRPALLLFALCLIDGDADAPRERIFAWLAGALALALGVLNAYSEWAMNYRALPVEQLDRIVKDVNLGISAMTAVALAIAFWRARLNDRHRIGWIAAAFLFAGAARLASDAFYPARIPLSVNSVLVSVSIVPIVAIWIAVVRHRFFNVDFVVSRAVVYVALIAALIGSIWAAEETATYIFVNQTTLGYAMLSAVLMGVASMTGKIVELFKHLVDRFLFRDRHQQRVALEFIAGYILDAETNEDVYRALLQDAAHALKLSFGGLLARQPDGSYRLTEKFDWPDELEVRLTPSDELTRTIVRSRGALTFTGKETRLIQQSFPNERLAFAAPLFYDRNVGGIVVYGHNISGLDLDPEEREHLVRVVAHASIALNAIELAHYRALVAELPKAEREAFPDPAL